jgi:hypothetical protein
MDIVSSIADSAREEDYRRRLAAARAFCESKGRPQAGRHPAPDNGYQRPDVSGVTARFREERLRGPIGIMAYHQVNRGHAMAAASAWVDH